MSKTADAKSSRRTGSGPSGAVRLAPEAELQRMGDKAYFADAIKLPPGELYVSPLNLMGEDGAADAGT